MLKKISRLFLGLIVCAGSVCVTPTHASSADTVIITHIQASGALGARDEYVAIHNNSGNEVTITDWCLVNKSSIAFACFTSLRDDKNEEFILPAYGNAVLASEDHVYGNTYTHTDYSVIYSPTNQSSGSIVNGSDAISLQDSIGDVVDAKSWGSAIPTGKMYSRVRIMAGPDIYATANDTTDWLLESRSVPPISTVLVRESEIPTDPEVPEDPPEDEEPADQTAGYKHPIITEILPNPDGSDIGNEFIEIYNPNETISIALDTYFLHIGTDTVKMYAFPTGAVVPPLTYLVFKNTDISYTLVNSTGKVQLFGENNPVGDAVVYDSPKDGASWALIENTWQYTNVPSPGSINTVPSNIKDDQDSEEASQAKPCADNQFRNPDTGRCKLMTSTTSAPTPCKEGQERNSETNRCRAIALASTPSPCKEGQERNPETNRCRNIVKMSQAEHGIKGVSSSGESMMQWYYWAGIGAVLSLILAYALWEWRSELSKLWKQLSAKFARQ